MSNEQDNSDNFQEAENSIKHVWHDDFLKLVKELLQLEDSQESEKSQESNNLKETEKLGVLCSSLTRS